MIPFTSRDTAVVSIPEEVLAAGKAIYSGLAGSYLYGCPIPGSSDVDALYVYVADTRALISVAPPRDGIEGKSPDYKAYEIGKFLRLLLKGNPAVTEALWAPEALFKAHSVWSELVSTRERFLTRRTLRAYRGYAEDQLRKLKSGETLHAKRGEFGEKWAYHIVRLLFEATRLARGAPPAVRLEGTELKVIENIRAGKVPQEWIVGYVEAHVSKVEILEKLCRLPDDPPMDLANEVLLRIRQELWPL